MRTRIVLTAFLAIAAISSIATVVGPSAFADQGTSASNSGGQSACNDDCKGHSMVIPQADFNMGTQSSNSGGHAQNPVPIGATPQPNGESRCNDDCNGAVPAGATPQPNPMRAQH
jgi:hypothetical protein